MGSVFIEINDLEFCELTALQILADSVDYADPDNLPVLEVVYTASTLNLAVHSADCDGLPLVGSYQELVEHLTGVSLQSAKVSGKLSTIFSKMVDAQPTYLLKGKLEVVQNFNLGE